MTPPALSDGNGQFSPQLSSVNPILPTIGITAWKASYSKYAGGLMRSFANISLMLVVLALHTGCIISTTPTSNTTLYLARYESQVFLVEATNILYPGNTSMVFNWYVDGQLKDTANPVFLFTAWPEYFAQSVSIECIVEIQQHSSTGDAVIWSDARDWTVIVE